MFPYFRNKETEAQRWEVFFPGSHSWARTEDVGSPCLPADSFPPSGPSEPLQTASCLVAEMWLLKFIYLFYFF